MNQPLKIALVTGANKGIGLEVARQLAKAGCFVLMGARNAAAGEQAAKTLSGEGAQVRSIAIDLLDRETIVAAAAKIESEFGRLDILVNNAGVAQQGDGPPSTAALDVVEATLKTNFLGSVAVTQAMLPLLRKVPQPRAS